MGHRSADRVLLEERVRETGGAAADRGRDPGRPGAHDDHVHGSPRVARADRWSRRERRRDLEPLDERVLDEAHPRQLADDVDPLAARLEELVHLRELDASLGRAEDELDGAQPGTRPRTAMADTLGRVDERGDAVDKAQNLPLGTGTEARSAADADVRIDDRMERHRDVQLQLDGLVQRRRARRLAAPDDEVQERDEHRDADQQEGPGRRPERQQSCGQRLDANTVSAKGPSRGPPRGT